MNFAKYLTLATACILTFAACTKEPVSATDPLPLPDGIEKSKDTSRKPGDSFYDYCNGTWIKNTPVPAAHAVGPMYDQDLAVDALLEELKASNPHMKRYYELRNAESGNPAESKAYLDALKAKFPKPTTVEEYFMTFGKMMTEGIFPSWDYFFLPAFQLVWVDGKQKGMLMPIDKVPETTPAPEESDNDTPFCKPLPLAEFSSYIDVPTTNAGEISAESLIIQGMGLDPSGFVTSPDVAKLWDAMNKMTVEELQIALDNTWNMYYEYATEKLLSRHRTVADFSIGYTRSYHFAQKFVSPELKEKLMGITKDIQSALRNRIQNVEWMSEATKANAIDKLDNISLNVMSPDKWYMDCIPDMSECKTLVESIIKGNKSIFNLRRQLIGTSDIFSYLITTSPSGVPMDLTFVNALYSHLHNAIIIYPALFLPPMLPENVSDAYAYAVFMIIGHEFTHAFDNNGAQYDKFGNQKNWWTIADKMSFEERSAIYEDCHNHLEIDPVRKPGVYNDGKKTLGENIADLGGFLAALDAYSARLDQEGYTGETKKEQVRKFFESFAHFWQSQFSDSLLEKYPKKDVHSISRLRVNGVVMNVDLWYDLYGVDRNCNLYLPEERRTYIW